VGEILLIIRLSLNKYFCRNEKITTIEISFWLFANKQNLLTRVLLCGNSSKTIGSRKSLLCGFCHVVQQKRSLQEVKLKNEGGKNVEKHSLSLKKGPKVNVSEISRLILTGNRTR
jgi:hypothetical protein